MRAYTFRSAPKGDAFADLLRAGLKNGATLLLVVRSQISLSDFGTNLLKSLGAYALVTEEAAEWPGTRLLSGTASLHRFKAHPDLIGAVLKASDCLGDWQQPRLPEDLSILRGDGTPWLTAITHEGDAYLSLTDEEAEDLRNTYPALIQALVLDDDDPLDVPRY